MATQEASEEWRRLSENYRQMSDGEIVELASQPSELTEVAQQILQEEVSRRKLTVPAEEPDPEYLPPDPDDNSEYAEDRKLVGLCTVWSRADALQLQDLLDRSGIPFFLGPELATRVDAVTSNFSNGVDVQVMQIGRPYASAAMSQYTPADEPADVKASENEAPEAFAIHCPKCHSAEVTLEQVENASAEGSSQEEEEKFEWLCDDCGHHWEDDGVETAQ